MPLPRAVVAASCAVAALALAGCGNATTTSGDSPTVAIPSDVGAPTTTATAPAPSATPTTSAPPATTSTAASASASPSATPGRILDFKGIHLLLPVEESDLPGIPDGLRSALAAGLKQRWDAYGDNPQCEKGPAYVINKVDTGGWAAIDSWDDPGVSGPKCAGVGGGYTGFWADVEGTWQEVIKAQDLPTCARFAKYHFPVAIVGDACAGPDGSEQPYRG